MEELMNKTPMDIVKMYEDLREKEEELREAIRMFLSRTLMDYSYPNFYECDIPIESRETFGLSSLQMPWIVKMWQDECEGVIYFIFDGGREMEFDEMETNELMQIVEAFK